ncbi:MAG TPA: FecR domain-containing protein [Flavihumibacter sp.]
MSQSLDKLEEIISDEQFQSWYFNTDAEKGRMWEDRRRRGLVDPALVAEAIELMDQFRLKESGPSDAEVLAAEQGLWNEIATLEANTEIAGETVLIPWFKRPLRVAAAVILLAGAGWLANLYFNPSVSTFKTSYGELKQNLLPDGSVVTLNGNSSVRYQHTNLVHRNRELWMEGEGYFEVTQQPNKAKFTVHLGNLDVVVTGTSFNIYNRPHKTEVLLTTGAVTIHSPSTGDSLHLVPGEQALISDGKLVKKTGNISQVTGWKQRTFIFENTSLEEVAQSVEVLYGIKVRLEGDTTSKRTISAILPADNLDIFLQSLEATQEFCVKKQGNDVLIGPARP